MSAYQTTATSGRGSLPVAALPFHRKVLLFAAAMTIALSTLWAFGAAALLDFYVGREPDPVLAARVDETGRLILWGGFALIVLFTVLGMLLLERLVTRWVAGPAGELARAAELVAAGDLTVTVHEGGIDEIHRLSRATIVMIGELRRLAAALLSSSGDTTRLAEEISAAAQELAAGAGEMATTAGALSEQSTRMAAGIQGITGASDRLAGVAADLDRGAHATAERNRVLRQLALENRARLDESSQVLGELSVDAAAGVAAVEALVAASEEIRTFVTQVRKLARQSKLLALNAAMEAARAGDEGEGFAVVANEVRRLAAMSADAAERTERVVEAVLERVDATRQWSLRTEETVRQVSDVTATGAQSFAQIEATVGELDAWAGTMEQSASAAHQLTQEITSQLGALSLGTDTFASAMEQVAASSEQQSAATEQVAAAAAHLTTAAGTLAAVVAHLRVDDESRGGQAGERGAAAPAARRSRAVRRATAGAVPVPVASTP